MLRRNSKAIFLSLICVASSPVASFAEEIDFDCDAMPSRTSSITQIVGDLPRQITGELLIVEKRAGRHLPLAGVLLSPASSEHQKDFVGLQIAASRDGSETSNISIRDHNGSADIISNVKTISDRGPKTFSIDLASTGVLSIAVGKDIFKVDVPRAKSWTAVRVMAMCSQGQFKFRKFSITKP